MNKKILYLVLSLTMISFIGCGNKTTPSKDSNSKMPSTESIQTPNTTVTEPTPFTLTDNSSYFCPFVFDGTDLIFPNFHENNKISTILSPSKDSVQISPETSKILADYSTDNIALIDRIIYFSNGSDNNALCSFNIADKTYTKLNTHSIHNLISVNTDLYYINKNDEHKIYKYDTLTSIATLICSDNVGSFIVNGDFIIYQNLSDNSKLYFIKTDGTNRQKLTDYTANSFVVYDGQLLFFNSSDNNNLYSIDPSTLDCNRLSIMNGFQLKAINKSLYFINGNDSNNLYSLSVDLKKLTAAYKPEISKGINEYFLTPSIIFYISSPDVNTIQLKSLSAQS